MTTVLAIEDVQPQAANARAFWLGWGADDRAEGDVTLYRSGIGHEELNGVIRVGEISVEKACAEASRWLAGVPWLWWVGLDSRPGLADELTACGATLARTMPMMAIDIDRLRVPERPPGLVISQVTEHSDIRDWVDAYGPCFEVPAEQLDAVSRLEIAQADSQGSSIRFAGRINGRIVGTSMLFDHDGVAGVNAVTTVPAFRRRGIGAHLTAVALLAGRERGLRIGTLQASLDGAPLYHRLGFTEVATYHLFHPNPAWARP